MADEIVVVQPPPESPTITMFLYLLEQTSICSSHCRRNSMSVSLAQDYKVRTGAKYTHTTRPQKVDLYGQAGNVTQELCHS